MARRIYSMLASLDGYVEDADGGFAWATPSEEVHAFANEIGASVGTYLYGRRMYETMLFWETAHEVPGMGAVELAWARSWTVRRGGHERADRMPASWSAEATTTMQPTTRMARGSCTVGGPEPVRPRRSSPPRGRGDTCAPRTRRPPCTPPTAMT